MATSQNATFFADEPETIGDHIRGESIATQIHAMLPQFGWKPTKIDDWRDSGFVFTAKRVECELDIVVTQMPGESNRWIMQIAPTKCPGPIGRFFGSVPSAGANATFELACTVNDILLDLRYTAPQWCWDGFADGSHCTPKPTPE